MFVHNFTGGQRWLSGIVTQHYRQSMVDLQLEDGRVIRRHLDHVEDRTSSRGSSKLLDSDSDCALLDLPSTMVTTWEAPDSALVEPVTNTTCRRSTRIRQAPVRLRY